MAAGRPGGRRGGAARRAEGAERGRAHQLATSRLVSSGRRGTTTSRPPGRRVLGGRRLGRRLLQADRALGIRQPEPSRAGPAGRPATRDLDRQAPGPQVPPTATQPVPDRGRAGHHQVGLERAGRPDQDHHRPPVPQAGLEAAGVGLPASWRHLEQDGIDPVERGRHRGGPLRPGRDVDQEELREDHAQLPRRGQPQAPQADGRHPGPRGGAPGQQGQGERGGARAVGPGDRAPPQAGLREQPLEGGQDGEHLLARQHQRLRPQAHRTEPVRRGGDRARSGRCRCRRPRHGPSVANRCSTHKRAAPRRSRPRWRPPRTGSADVNEEDRASPAARTGSAEGVAGAVSRRTVQGVEQGHHGPPVGRPSVRTDGPGVRLVDDGVAPGQDRHPVERAPEGGDGLLAGAASTPAC